MHRIVPRIARFVHGLLASSTVLVVQHVHLPPHHIDGPTSDPPQCKGFALVKLAATEEAESLLRDWPWEPEPGSVTHTESGSGWGAADAAARFALRALSLRRWSELRYEYVAYRRRLLERMHETVAPEAAAATTATAPSYPADSLLFIRNVHTGANKTTLRTLLSRAFLEPSSGGIDYVDYTKGMECVCGIHIFL